MQEAMQRNQLLQQQTQAQTLENQQRQQSMKDQEIMRQSYMEGQGDLNKTLQLSMQRGASPTAVTALQQHILATKQTMANIDEATLKATSQKHDMARGNLLAFEQQPQEVKEQRWPALLDGAHQQGLLSDQEYQQAKQQYPTYPGPEAVKTLANGYASGSILAQEAVRDRTAAAAEARANATQQNALTNVAKADAAQKEKQRIDASASLAAAAMQGKDAYKQAYDATPHGIALQFPDPEKFDPATTPKAIRYMGMTPAQQSTAEVAGQTHADNVTNQQGTLAERAQHNREMESLARDRVNNGTGGKETPAQHKTNISRLADQAIAENAMNGAGTIESTLGSVENPAYYQNHPIGDNRGEIAKELRARQGQAAAVQQKEQAVESKDQLPALQRLQWMKDHPGQPVPTKTQLRQQPAATPQKPAPAATPAPAQPGKRYTLAGSDYAVGDPIRIKGKDYVFQGLDPSGKVLAIPK